MKDICDEISQNKVLEQKKNVLSVRIENKLVTYTDKDSLWWNNLRNRITKY